MTASSDDLGTYLHSKVVHTGDTVVLHGYIRGQIHIEWRTGASKIPKLCYGMYCGPESRFFLRLIQRLQLRDHVRSLLSASFWRFGWTRWLSGDAWSNPFDSVCLRRAAREQE